MSDVPELGTPEREPWVRNRIREEADLRVSVGEHMLAWLRDDPLAGDFARLPYEHSVDDIRWDSTTYYRLNDPSTTHEHPELVEAIRLATWVREELMQAARDGSAVWRLDDESTVRQAVLNVAWRCGGSIIDLSKISPELSNDRLWKAHRTLQEGKTMPDTPEVNLLVFTFGLFRNAYLSNHPGLQTTL